MASACTYHHVKLDVVVLIYSSPCGLCAGVMSRRAGVSVNQQAAERKMGMIRFIHNKSFYFIHKHQYQFY